MGDIDIAHEKGYISKKPSYASIGHFLQKEDLTPTLIDMVKLTSLSFRSNAETTVHMIKSRFGDSVKSKTWNAQVNEMLCKIICHNICVVIQEMFELGIKTDFNFCVESRTLI